MRSAGGNSAGDPVETWMATLGECSVRVVANRSGLDALLKHALGAHAAIVPAPAIAPAAEDWTVRVLACADYKARLAELGARPAVKDGTCPLENYWRGDFPARRLGRKDGGAAVHHSGAFEGVTLFEAEPKAVTYLFPSETPVFLPHVEHLIGHVFRLERWRSGFVDLHAAFLRYRDKGVALVGPRRAGKTSLAMHLVARGAELLGSDMAQIRIGAEGEIEAAAVPHMCRITRETVLDNGLLAAAIGEPVEGKLDYVSGPVFSFGKYEFYDAGLERVFGRPVAVSAMRLDAFLFPHFEVGLARQGVRAASPDEAVRRIVRSVGTDRPLADWLPFDLSERGRGEAELERRLMAGDPPIQAYDFAFGREPSLEWDSIDALFDRM